MDFRTVGGKRTVIIVATVSIRNPEYLVMAQSCFRSLMTHNPTIRLICVHDGLDNTSLHALVRLGAEPFEYKLPYAEDIRSRYNGAKSLEHALSSYLCVDVPVVMDSLCVRDDVVLYLDVDTLVVGELPHVEFGTAPIAAAPEWHIDDWSTFNAGVLGMRWRWILNERDNLLRVMREHSYSFDRYGKGPCDQGLWNLYFATRCDHLPPELNWKPFWGVNPNAVIIHFMGPKMAESRALLNSREPVQFSCASFFKDHRIFIDRNPEGYRYYLDLWSSNNRS
jgi:lipopolysaccharide biosynthesis glycosyltransferase